MILSRPQSGRRRITLVPMIDVLFILLVYFMVTSVFGYDDASGVVSFRGTEQGDPGTIHTYTVKDDGSEFTCVTCDTAMPDQRFQCKDNSVQFSPDRQHYLHR